MRVKFPNYSKVVLRDLFFEFSDDNKKLIKDFLEYCSITGGKSTIFKIERVLIKIFDVFDFSMNNLNLNDIRSFLALLNKSHYNDCSRNEIKKVLKRFLRWCYKDWSERFDSFYDVKLVNDINDQKVNSSTILTNEELQKLILGCSNLRQRAMLVILSESGCRPEELLNLKWGDINFKEDYVNVTFYSHKTKQTRILPLKESLIHLERYKREFPLGLPKSTSLLFYTPSNPDKPWSSQCFSLFVSRLGHKTIGRHVYPYLIRHTILTNIYKNLSTQVGSKFAGHSSEMSSRYTHLSTDDLRNELFSKVYHVEDVQVQESLAKRVEVLENLLKKVISSVKPVLTKAISDYPK